MSVLEPTTENIIYVPIAQLTVPAPGLIEHYKDHWWSVDEERGALFWLNGFDLKHRRFFAASPQCNSDERSSKQLTARMYPWCTVVLIPSAFVRHRCER